jgi:trigger factor
LKIEVDSVNTCKREVTIEVEEESLRGDYDSVCSKYLKQARVPGFRPGKAPLSLIKQRFKDAIREDFLEVAVQKSFRSAIQSENLSPLESPHIHDLSYAEGRPLRFKAVFEVLPKLEIRNYKGLEIERIPVEVKDEEVEHSLLRIRERLAQYSPVEDRAVQQGDFAVISYTGKFSGGTEPPFRAQDVYCEVGGAETLPEFTENLVGARSGETRTFTIKYAPEFPNKKLAGKEVEYTLELHSIKLKKLPDLNDDFARDVGDFKTLEECRSKIRNDLIAEKEQMARSQMQTQLLDQVIETNAFEVPEVLVQKQTEDRLNDYVRTLVAQGIHPQTLNLNWAQFQERQREQAIRDVKVGLVLENIADQEDLHVTDKEVDEEISRRAKEAQQPFEAVKSRLTKDGGADRMKHRLRNRKSLDLLLSTATFKDPQSVIIQP